MGKTLFLNYSLYQIGGVGAAAGTGGYEYLIPAAATIDTTYVTSSTNAANGNTGTKVGTVSIKRYGVDNGTGNVYVTSGGRLMLWLEVGTGGYGIQSNAKYDYSLSGFGVTFEAAIPIT